MHNRTFSYIKTFFIVFVLCAILPAAAAEKEKPLFDYHQSQLGNGLNVITLEDFSCPIVTVQVWYGVGSKNEKSDRQGYAHMFEHMMFKGTDVVGPKDHFQLITKTGGTLNAYTSFDKTVYHETLPVSQIELALWLEAERMAFLKIDQQAFDTERNVVIEELRMGENEPYGTLYKKLAAEVFTVHPYRWTPIGSIACLRATSVADLRAFWQQYYVPNNATLIVVGAIKHDEAVKLAHRYFGWIQKRPAPPQVTKREPMPEKPRTIIIDDENAPAGMAGYIFRTVPAGDKDESALDFLAEILGGSKSSRLYRDLVAEKQLAVQASAMTWNLQQDGVFMVGAVQAPGTDANAILSRIKDSIERIQNDSVTAEELETARNQKLYSIVTDNLTIDSKASVLGNAAVIVGDLNYANTMLDKMQTVTVADIQRVAKTYLQFNRRLEVTVKENTKPATKDDENAPITAAPETQAPAPGRTDEKRPAAFPAKAPIAKPQAPNVSLAYTENRLKNGARVLVVSNHETPFVTVKLGLSNGATTENKIGTANLALQMLTRGTKSRTEKELSQELSRHAISLGGSAEMDYSQVNMACLTEHLDKGMKLLADVVINPVFDAGEFEKLQRQTLTSLQIDEQNPEYLADKEFSLRLYGQHRYAHTIVGESNDIQKLTPEDLKKWWSHNARSEDAVLIFAGDIQVDTAIALAMKYLGDWKSPDCHFTGPVADFPKEDKTQIWLVDNPGSAQTQIRIGCRSITRKDQPDYFISRIVSNYFGGSFHSWVNETLRVEKGLTYGASAQYEAQQLAGQFVISTFTKNESAGLTVQTILDLIQQLREKQPTSEELDLAKDYITGSFLRRRETPQQIADDLWLLESERLDKDYFDKLLKGVTATNAADCIKLTDKTILPGKLVIVVVGDAAKIKPDLEKIATVKVVEKTN